MYYCPVLARIGEDWRGLARGGDTIADLTENNRSLVLGFCRCDSCGYEKFYYNTHFRCANCGGYKYTHPNWEEELLNEKEPAAT